MPESRPLEVLVVGYGSSDVPFIDRLITGLLKRGLHVTVAAPRRKDLNRIQASKPNWLHAPRESRRFWLKMVSLIGLLISNPGFHQPAWFSGLLDRCDGWRSRFEVLYRYLPFARKKWDVIYFPWNSAAIDYIGLYDAGMPVVVSCRGSQVNIRPHRPGQDAYVTGLKTTLTKADAVHCVSQDILEEATRYGLNETRAVVIPAAIDTDFFTPLPRPGHNTLRLITTGSLVWVKGHEYLLMALGILRDVGLQAELYIIGEGPERDRILFTARDLGLSDQVKLHGRLPAQQVREQLQQADIFVLSSLSEGISNAVLEAMSCGLPVVTVDCGGMREAVTDGVEGYIVPVREPRRMAEAIQKLAQDPGLRKRMGAAGRERVLRDFRLADQVDAFVALFKSLQTDLPPGGE